MAEGGAWVAGRTDALGLCFHADPSMVLTIQLSPVLVADAARVARASGTDSVRQQRGAPPTAADSIGPAVVNHVRGRGSSSEVAADSGKPESAAGSTSDSAADSAAGASTKQQPEEEHAEEIRSLQKRDAEVRAHEQAHAAAGGAFAGAPSYGYQRGPDGRSYAVSGEVPIDVSAVSGDPEATIQKMQQVKRAALAPRDPSHADRAIAASADALIVAARREQMSEKPATDEGATAGDAARREQMSGNAATGEGATAGDTARAAFSANERRRAGAAAYTTASAS